MRHDRSNRRGIARGAAGLGFATLVTSTVLALGGACSGNGRLDICHPDEGIAPPDLCCPDPTVPTCPDAGDGGEGDATADAPLEPACSGQCVSLPPNAWDIPTFVWMGAELEAPPCPEAAPKLAYEAYAGLNAPNVCGACQCDPPTGSCGLPAILTAWANSCADAGAGTPQTPFDPPAGWDGGCTTNDAVPAGQDCDGGPCVQSLTIAPLAVTESGCTPTQLPVPKGLPATWSTFARSCKGIMPGSCGSNGLLCIPQAPPGFRVCVFRDGDQSCSDPWLAPYSEKYLFFQGFEDTRSCSPCTCAPPTGSTCSGMISVFSDDACSTSLVSSYLVDSSGPACVDLVAGSAVGSKSAGVPTYTPGSCHPSGGEPMGSADPSKPGTFCCIPSP